MRPRPRSGLAWVWALAASAWAFGCAARPDLAAQSTTARREPRAAPSSPGCDYDVTVARWTAVLDVSVRCKGFRHSAFLASPPLVRFASNAGTVDGSPLAPTGSRYALPARAPSGIDYRMDLDRASEALDDVDLALSIGRSIIAPASSFLLRPEPAPPELEARVRVTVPPGSRFATGLERRGDAFVVRAPEIRTATYSIFGAFESDVISLPSLTSAPAGVDVAFLDGAFRMPPDARLRWVSDRVRAVASFYGGFPVSHAVVAVAPIPGRDEVLHGELLPSGGNAIAVLVGADTTEQTLGEDWILVHELFHIGSPSFVGEGKWLDEGLATYEEPVIRARAHMLTERAAWHEIVRGMPRGRHLCETTGLEHFGDDFRSVYWGGAVVALLADVEARRRTAGARGLEDGLRTLLARGGDASRVWTEDDAIRVIDEGIGSPVLAELAARYRDHGSSVPLEGVLAELGVVPTEDGVNLVEGAPLASVRRAIMWGTRAEAMHPK